MAISEIQRLESKEELYSFNQAFGDDLYRMKCRIEAAQTVYNKFDVAEMDRLQVPGTTATDSPERLATKSLRDFFNEFMDLWEGTAVTPGNSWESVSQALHNVKPV